MKISTKGRYALRLLLDLAQHRQMGAVALKDVAQRQEVSKKYLEQIIPAFTKSGILRTTRGFQGGYELNVSPDKITVGDILRLTEGSLSPLDCVENNGADCPRGAECQVLWVWKGLSDAITGYLDGVTLQDILDRSSGSGYDYVI